MKRYSLIAILLSLALLASCNSATSESSDSGGETSETTSETTPAEVTETSESTETSSEESHYVHGDEGYFCLPEMGYATEMRTQSNAICWACAATTCAESNYIYTHGEEIRLSPMDLANYIYRIGFNEDVEEDGVILPPGSVRLGAGSAVFGSYDGCLFQAMDGLIEGINGYYLTDVNVFGDNPEREALKAYLQEYGGLKVSIFVEGKLYLADYVTLNYPYAVEEDYGHAVVLIGWDDNFPAELFAYDATQNGAWILQDSLMGKVGYLYMSYDSNFIDVTSFAVSDEYNDCVSYDMGCLNTVCTGDTTKIANVFSSDEALRGVGVFFEDDDADVTIEIYNSDFSELVYTQDVHADHRGYHVFELEEPLEPGTYAVAVAYNGSAPVEGEPFDVDGVTIRPFSREGESYIYADGRWVDTNDPDIKDILGIDFYPNNCCVTALY